MTLRCRHPAWGERPEADALDLANGEAQIIGKGGDAQRIFWDSEAGRFLARLIGGRTRGPVFLADKRPSQLGHRRLDELVHDFADQLVVDETACIRAWPRDEERGTKDSQ
jgi:hypothetical protein